MLGEWLVEEKNAIIKIYESDGLYHGKVMKLMPDTDDEGNPLVDDKNPDPTKHNTPIIGMNTVTDMRWNGEYLEGGRLYDPGDGKSYTGKMWLEGDKLKVRGYVGFLYKTQTWERRK